MKEKGEAKKKEHKDEGKKRGQRTATKTEEGGKIIVGKAKTMDEK